MEMNIRKQADRAAIESKGYTVVTVVPRGDDKGKVVSRHRTLAAAEKRANGRDLTIVFMDQAHYF